LEPVAFYAFSQAAVEAKLAADAKPAPDSIAAARSEASGDNRADDEAITTEKEKMVRSKKLERNWPVFFKNTSVVDHIHVLFSATLQATIEPVKAELTTLDFQKEVKMWQKQLDRPYWLESQSSVQKFWSQTIELSVQSFVQSVFEDFTAAPVVNNQLFVSSKIHSTNDIGNWRIASSCFQIQVINETHSQVNMSIQSGKFSRKDFKVVNMCISTNPGIFFVRNPSVRIKPLEVEVEKKSGKKPKTYFMYPCVGHEACVQKLLQLWRLVQNGKYTHSTQHTAISLKNAFATIPRLLRSDNDKFGEVMCLFQSLSHEDANAGLQLVTEILCQYEPSPSKPSLSMTNPLQFTGLRSLRMCLRNFSDQKETLCCVLVLLLKLLLWKKSSSEVISFDEGRGLTQVPLKFVFFNEIFPILYLSSFFLIFLVLQSVLSQAHFTLVGGIVSHKFVMVLSDIARLSGDWEVSQLALALIAICISRDLTYSIANLLCKEPEMLNFLTTTAFSQEKINNKKVGLLL
jgi:hypothetical protein